MDAPTHGPHIPEVPTPERQHRPQPQPQLQPAPALLEREPIALSWSGGKDATLALLALLAEPELRVAALLTTVRESDALVATHEVPLALVEAQASALGIPLHVVKLPDHPTNAEYERRIGAAFRSLRAQGICRVAFGDLFLDDVRMFREAMLAPLGMRGVYPLWGRDTAELAVHAIELGVRALLVSVDTRALDPGFCGRELDVSLLAELPAACDPCGERGEYHTFVFDAPAFGAPVAFTRGRQADRDGMRHLALHPPA